MAFCARITSAAASLAVSGVVEGADDLDARIQRGFLLDPVHALAQVRRVRVSREDRHRALLAKLCGELAHHRPPELLIVHAVEREALRFGRATM